VEKDLLPTGSKESMEVIYKATPSSTTEVWGFIQKAYNIFI
jgi:hypothetical protein